MNYRTDGGVALKGFLADGIKVTNGRSVIFDDGVGDGSAWTLDGFRITGGTETSSHPTYYIAENKGYRSYNVTLKDGPYNFGFLNTKPDWVEHFSYQQGLLISYNDTSVADNNVNQHPGQGRNLIIDSHPAPFYNLEGVPWRARIQLYDAPFGLTKADSFTLHVNGKPSYIRGQAARPTFDDTKKYFYDEIPWAGVKLPAVGVKIKVVEQKGTSLKVKFS
jgi:immune inhibitor A